MSFPQHRLRRLRASEGLRRLVRQARLVPEQLIMPLFVTAGRGIRRPIAPLPGIEQRSVDLLASEAKALARLGIGGVILFGIPARKDALGTGAYAADGVVQRGIRAVKAAAPSLVVATDVCLCEYTDHGHCGVVKRRQVDNDATLALLGRIAVSQAKAGADMVAPSAMMDGQVAAIRRALDAAGHPQTPILSYSTKHASSLYGPFRAAAGSTPRFGDRTAYQMDPANGDEALREVALDLEEGADIVMVKPALTSLDLIHRIKARFGVPVAAYQVSGEYAMLRAAGRLGWLDEARAMREMLVAIRRAGADCIITYWAKAFAEEA